MAYRFRRLFGVALAMMIGTVAMAGPAGASYFTGRYADDNGHSFVSIESNDTDYNQIDPLFKAAMTSLDSLTDLYDQPKVRHDLQSWTDIYWYATDQSNFSNVWVNGSYVCVNILSNGRCDRGKVTLNEDRLNRTAAQIRHTICHEILHSVGFDDGWTGNDGCLPGWGTSSGYSDDITMNSHEINHINGFY